MTTAPVAINERGGEYQGTFRREASSTATKWIESASSSFESAHGDESNDVLVKVVGYS